MHDSRYALVVLGAALAVLVPAIPASATTWLVPSAECPTIQAGIDSAAVGDTVLVSGGTYTEHGINMKSGVCLKGDGGHPGDVTIDGGYGGTIIYCDGVDSTARIEGVTITHGEHMYAGGGMRCINSSPVIADVVFSDCVIWDQYNYDTDGGAALYCENSSPTLTDVVFSDNYSQGGGGAFQSRGASSPVFTRVRFIGNEALHYGGGAVSCIAGSSPVFIDCLFHDNTSGAGGYLGGGGAFVMYGSAVFSGCHFAANHSITGGGICSWTAASTVIEHCVIERNVASEFGGGIYCYQDQLLAVTSTTIVRNGAPSAGGILMGSTITTLENVIIVHNQGEAVGGSPGSPPVVTCCDIYGNTGGDWAGPVAGHNGVDGNISLHPLFCSNDNPDDPYSLHSNSPCAPEFNPACGLIGARGVGCGASAVEQASWGVIKAMYR